MVTSGSKDPIHNFATSFGLSAGQLLEVKSLSCMPLLLVLAGNIWVHLATLLACMAVIAAGMFMPLPLAGSALLSLLLPVMLCLAGSVSYHTLMANHWNYKLYITMDVSCTICMRI